jgi:hypothetical protein
VLRFGSAASPSLAATLPEPVMASLSEGTTPLTRTFGGPGRLVHRAGGAGAFVTLFVVPIGWHEAAEEARGAAQQEPGAAAGVDARDGQCVRVTAGECEFYACVPIADAHTPVLRDFWVDAHTEVRVSAPIARRWAVHGYVVPVA